MAAPLLIRREDETSVVSKTVSKSRAGKFRDGWVDGFLWFIRIAAILVVGFGIFRSVVMTLNGEGTSIDAWENLIVSGVAQGAMYGMLALGYSMVYGVLGFINFAHGEVFMGGAMVSFFVAQALFDNGVWESNFALSLFIILIVAVLTSTLIAVIVERVAYRPLRDAPRIIPLITSIGISFFLQYTFAGLFGEGVKTYPTPPDYLRNKVNVLGFLPIEGTKILVMVVALISMIGLYFYVQKTRAGRAMRAVAEDKEIAALMGINVDRTIVSTFAVGGAMAGVAGILWALLFRSISFITGFLPGIKAFTAAVLGGIGNLAGAMVGGIVLGLFENVGTIVVLGGLGIPGAGTLKDVISFSALVLVLVFRPRGLFGERLSHEDRP
ncbi:high-affinity branched-chain amino acid transport system permease protein LivH [bacterium BMS3Bbin02]|nr:high-affinity branched-chain amino acid transport system permease protein LivH [bacterium BMS3Bbin02]